MNVSDVLSAIKDPMNTLVKIYQTPISRIDSCKDNVLRQYATVADCLTSKQNYLEYKVANLCQEAGIITIVCTANEQQENEVIRGFYENYYMR